MSDPQEHQQPDPDLVPDLSKLPAFICEALDRETLEPENLLFMCGIDNDELFDQLAEFESNPDSLRDVPELTAFRVGMILDNLTSYCGETAISQIGKATIKLIADLALEQVVLEERAVIRHQAKVMDHNCQDENCPMGSVIGYDFAKPNGDLFVPDYQPRTYTLPTAELFESEWE